MYQTTTVTAEKLLTLKFYQGKNETVIAKTPNGKLALPDNKSPMYNAVKPNEHWEVEVKEEKPRCIIVTPIQKLV